MSAPARFNPPTEDDLREFIDLSLNFLCIAGTDGYFKHVNPAWETTFGYTKEEGLAFTPAALGTNSNAQIAVDKGDTEFAVGTPSFQFPLFAKGQLPPIVNYYEYTYPYKWDVAVKPDSGVQKYEDLKGKKIGVSDMGTTDYPVTRAVLQNIGIDPDKDVTWIAVWAPAPTSRAFAKCSRQIRLSWSYCAWKNMVIRGGCRSAQLTSTEAIAKAACRRRLRDARALLA